MERDFDGVAMVLVPQGCFQMGTTDEQMQYAINELGALREWIDDEIPAHEQCFDTPFWIDKTEVVQADFERFDGRKTSTNWFDGDQRPVENITWFEARDFCAVRGARLPTEREWEYAARGPDNLIYPWGNHWNESNAVWSGSSNHHTAPIGSHLAGRSWVGALDMSGNVWEWMSTVYGIDDGDHNYSEGGERRFIYPYSATDGREQDNQDTAFVRAVRGGSWNYFNISLLRASYRDGESPNHTFNNIGFRCARDF